MVVKEGDDARTAGRTAESPDPLEDRQKRLAGSVLLDALPARDPCLRPGTVLRRQKRLEEGGLADPSLAGHKYDLAVARKDPAPDGLQHGELLRAPDYGRLRRRRAAGAGGWRSAAALAHCGAPPAIHWRTASMSSGSSAVASGMRSPTRGVSLVIFSNR